MKTLLTAILFISILTSCNIKQQNLDRHFGSDTSNITFKHIN